MPRQEQVTFTDGAEPAVDPPGGTVAVGPWEPFAVEPGRVYWSRPYDAVKAPPQAARWQAVVNDGDTPAATPVEGWTAAPWAPFAVAASRVAWRRKLTRPPGR